MAGKDDGCKRCDEGGVEGLGGGGKSGCEKGCTYVNDGAS